jgi:hypothetical protein
MNRREELQKRIIIKLQAAFICLRYDSNFKRCLYHLRIAYSYILEEKNMCDNNRFEILKDQNKFNLQLSDNLLNIFELAKENLEDCRELVSMCGGLSMEHGIRRKIAELNQTEHEKDLRRIEHKTEKITKLNNQERINAEYRDAG